MVWSPSPSLDLPEVPTVTRMGRPGVAILVTVTLLHLRVVFASEKCRWSQGAAWVTILVTVITLRPSCRCRISSVPTVTGIFTLRFKSAKSHMGLPGGLQAPLCPHVSTCCVRPRTYYL